MKLSRKLVPAIAMLLVSAVMLSTASFAWFSMNTTVTASDLEVKAQAMGSLVISNSAGDIGTTHKVTTSLANIYDETLPAAKTLIDATHDAAQYAADGTWKTGLKTLTAAQRADVVADGTNAGKYEGSGTLVPVEDGTNYYIDYTVYIAAKADALTGKKLTATLESSGADYHEALAIDFYVKTGALAAPTKETYVNTIKAGEAAEITEGYAAAADKAAAVMGIPLQSENYITVIMRVYIDGEHADANNNKWGADLAELGVTFNIVTPTP